MLKFVSSIQSWAVPVPSKHPC